MEVCETKEAIEDVTISGPTGVSSISHDSVLKRALYPSARQVVTRLQGVPGLKNFTTSSTLNITTGTYTPTWFTSGKLPSGDAAAIAIEAWRSSFTPSCPHGFVIPDDPLHPRNVRIEGTACAQACRYGDGDSL